MTNQEKQAARDFANELRGDVIAIELQRSSLSRSKTVTREQRSKIAAQFSADENHIRGSKILYPEKNTYIKSISSILNSSRKTWESLTIPYRKGVRLLRKDRLDSFIQIFADFESELEKALDAADANREEILSEAARMLNADLFDPGNYPASFKDAVSINWKVHNFEPPEELLQLAPATYKREQRKVQQQFQVALARYEDEARLTMGKLVQRMLNAIDAKPGKKGVYKEATANNLRKFIDDFESMGIESDADLNDLINRAKGALGDTTMGQLKRNPDKREDVSSQLADIEDKLKKLIIDAPERSISLDDLDD